MVCRSESEVVRMHARTNSYDGRVAPNKLGGVGELQVLDVDQSIGPVGRTVAIIVHPVSVCAELGNRVMADAAVVGGDVDAAAPVKIVVAVTGDEHVGQVAADCAVIA